MSDVLDSLTRGNSIEIAGHIPPNPALLHSVVSKEIMGPVEPITNSHGFQNLVVSNSPMRPTDAKAGTEGFTQTEAAMTGLGHQSLSLPIKRKAEMQLASSYSVPQQLAVPNKRAVPMGNSPRLPLSLQTSASHKKHVQTQSKATPTASQNLPALNKKLARNDSNSGKSGSHQVQTPKGRTMQMGSISKVKTQSNEAVRSRVRDQLASALSLVFQNKEESTNGEKNHVGEAGDQQKSASSQHSISDSSAVGAEEKTSHEFDNIQFQEAFSVGEAGESKKSFGETSMDESMGAPEQSSRELHSSIFPEEDGLFVKDDLLQGNGLSWAYEFDMGSTEVLEVHDTGEPKLADEESSGVTTDTKRASPEKLAFEIEAELFKLFGGVNKKYKEKGRSLLFNLKDRTNPELRERVMSGDIPPDRLCTMTAEELASKELSEWRMAKAEELAQMVVLPDTDFSRRRLVKKTHKGEYQVDFELDDNNLATDVSGGASALSQSQPETKDTEIDPSSKMDTVIGEATTEIENNKSENQEISGSLVIPNDGTDLMHGMMVDELKDAEFLPPIISLDEFMESLTSEPPFEDLQIGAAQSTLRSAKETQASHVSPVLDSVGDAPTTKVDAAQSPSRSSKENQVSNTSPVLDSVGNAAKTRVDEMVVKHGVDVAPKPSESPVVQKIPSPDAALPMIEHIWAGVLQLSISSSITTFGVFKSGERTSTAEWSSSLEIKGRVRLNAFEKFVKELPMSRTRAVMVLHLVLKDKSLETERANLAEAVESYVSDERLGFAEPAAGVELYVCPPHEKMLDVLGDYVADHRADILNSAENGLIGLVVWRKAPISSITSPDSSSHHKHSSKRQQHVTSGRPQGKDTDINTKSTPNAPPSPALLNRQLPVSRLPFPQAEDDDSDIPPGFGPLATRDDDDLPEFNFTGNTTPAMARTLQQNPMGSRVVSRPVDQIRQLIRKYGQNDPSVSKGSLLDNQGSGIGLAIEPWNDDDDDDGMPEWRPHMPLPTHHLARPLQPGVGNQHLMNARAVVSGSGSSWQHGPGRGQPSRNLGNQPTGGGFPARMRMLQDGQRQDGSRSRGF